jgi:lipoprotein-anchoring transpeptidase ErfK/SrfK
MGVRHGSFLAGAALLCLALPASVAARPGATPAATWVAPTPAEGHRFSATAGRELAFSVAASAPGAPIINVAIRAEGLPGNAALQTAAGNPATATVNWTPTSSQAGQTFNVRLTAQPGVLGISPATRNLTLAVQPLASRPPPPEPKPKPRPRRKPKTFVLSSTKHELYRYAFVIRSAVVRAAPRRTSAALARLARWTPEGTTNLVLTLEGRRTTRGVWIKVRLPILPANRTGWVKRKTLSDWKEIRTRLVVDSRQLTATLYRRGKAIFRVPVGVGVSRWPTPRGDFFVRNQLYGFGNPVYGPIAFGTSARSPVLTDWPGGGFIGIHGTDEPEKIPGRVSHGCIRMKNRDILRLARLMPVGTPLTVR